MKGFDLQAALDPLYRNYRRRLDEMASAVSTMTATQNMTVSAQIRRVRSSTGSAVMGLLSHG